MTDMYRVTTEFTGVAGLPGYNTLYGDTSISSASDFVTLIGEFWGTWATNHMSGLITATTFGAVTTVDPTTGDATGVVSGGPDVVNPGSISGDLVPFTTQLLCQLHTGVYVGGREIRGRIFCPGATESDASSGVPASGLVSSTADALTLLAESALVVYSPTHHEFASVGATSVWSQWASLRSRRD